MKYAQSSSAVVESNPFRIEVILRGLTWGSRLRDNPRLREVSPTGKTHSALLNQTSCGVWSGLSVERVFNLFNACPAAFRGTSTGSSVWNASGQKMNSCKGRLAGSSLIDQRSCRVFAVLAGAPTNLEVCLHGTDQMPPMGWEERALLNQTDFRPPGSGDLDD